MEIKEIRDLLPSLEIEVDKQHDFKREYFLDRNGRKVYVSDAIIDETKKWVAWIETIRAFDDIVEVKIYQLGSINNLKVRWRIFPVDEFCMICFMQFYEKELIIVWRDKNYHLVRIELPNADTEVEIKMLKLQPLIYFDGKQTISYQNYQSQSTVPSVQRIQIPTLNPLPSLTPEEAQKKGIELDEFWNF